MGIRYICMLAGHGISKPERFYPFCKSITLLDPFLVFSFRLSWNCRECFLGMMLVQFWIERVLIWGKLWFWSEKMYYIYHSLYFPLKIILVSKVIFSRMQLLLQHRWDINSIHFETTDMLFNCIKLLEYKFPESD